MRLRTSNLFLLVLLFVIGQGTMVVGQNSKISKPSYMVVVNHEEQYSIVLSDQKMPYGWKKTGTRGTQKDCQEYIEEVWTDMRPLSIKKLNIAEKMRYQVVVNHEEQYSIIPINLGIPKGYKSAGKEGTLIQCTNYIKKVWTDMRPLSLRKKMK